MKADRLSHFAFPFQYRQPLFHPFIKIDDIFSDLSTYKPDQWNIYSEIRRKLVEDHNIPEKQIKFIQEANSDNARKELFKDMNSGRIRFLFGSTQKLGTGVNAQERAVAIHHLDIP